MTWSYDDAQSTDKDFVRFLVGDTDSTDQLVSDEAIARQLADQGDPYQAAAMICDGLASRFGRVSTITIDGFTVSGKDRAEQFRAQASTLRRTAATASPGALGTPYVGGTSRSEIEAVQDDTDRVPSKFSVGQDDFPGTGVPQPKYSDIVP